MTISKKMVLGGVALCCGCSMFVRNLPEAQNPANGEELVVEERTTYEPMNRGGAKIDEDNKVVHTCDQPLPATRFAISTNDSNNVCMTYRGFTWNQSKDDDEFRHVELKYQVIVDSSRSEFQRLEVVEPPQFLTMCEQEMAMGSQPGPTYRVFQYTVQGCFDVALSSDSQKLFVFREVDELGAWQLR